jgi:hypothetical protein
MIIISANNSASDRYNYLFIMSVNLALSHVYALAFSLNTSHRLKLCNPNFEGLADAAILLVRHLQSDESLNSNANMQNVHTLLDLIDVRAVFSDLLTCMLLHHLLLMI